jgi:8-oxo-dGTP diphosphatase
LSILPLATLCFLVRDEPTEEILMGYKKIGFGQGKITGFGGKVEEGESVAEAARREMFEETALRVVPCDLSQVAILNFVFPHRTGWSQQVHVFLARRWEGEPLESDEMIPQWYSVHDLPYPQMWEDGRFWLPLLLEKRTIIADFEFAADNASVQMCEIRDHAFPAVESLGSQ